MSRFSMLSIEKVLKLFGESPLSEAFHLSGILIATKEEPFINLFTLDHYCIVLICSGTSAIQINAKTYHLDSGDMLTISPGSINKMLSASETLKFRIVSFESDYLLKLPINHKNSASFVFFTSREAFLFRLAKLEFKVIYDLLEFVKAKKKKLVITSRPR